MNRTERRARRACIKADRATERAERLVAEALPQTATTGEGTVLRASAPRRGLTIRAKAFVARRSLTGLLQHPKTAETAALVVGVAVGVVLAALALGAILGAALRQAEE